MIASQRPATAEIAPLIVPAGLINERTKPVRVSRGLYVGRFQPYHAGHHHVVREISDEVDELVVGIGSAGESHTERNPFTAGERLMMVAKATQEFDVETYPVPIEDLERNAVWVSHVQSMCPPFDVAYSNNPLVIQLFREAGIEVRQEPLFRREVLKGSELRSRMIADEPWREHVPQSVIGVIERVGGVERLQQIAGTDGAVRPARGKGDEPASRTESGAIGPDTVPDGG